MRAGFTTLAFSSSFRCINPYRLAHPAYGCNLVVEWLPVVAFRNRRPDSLDFVDMHRTRLRIGPIWVRFGAFATLERFGQRAERLGRISFRSGIPAAAP